MAKVNILIVEDDRDILNLLAYNFRNGGYEVMTCETGSEAVNLAKEHLPDLVLLDLMIPGMDGLEVCRELKRSATTRNIPVIMLTARGERWDRIVGPGTGTDDYVVKTVQSPWKLMLRGAPCCAFPGWTSAAAMWLERGPARGLEAHQATVDGRGNPAHRHRIPAAGGTQPLIAARCKPAINCWIRSGVIIRRLCPHCRYHVRRLRQMLGSYCRWIETVRGVGYRLRS